MLYKFDVGGEGVMVGWCQYFDSATRSHFILFKGGSAEFWFVEKTHKDLNNA